MDFNLETITALQRLAQLYCQSQNEDARRQYDMVAGLTVKREIPAEQRSYYWIEYEQMKERYVPPMAHRFDVE